MQPSRLKSAKANPVNINVLNKLFTHLMTQCVWQAAYM